MNQNQLEIPIQPVEQPILCSPYEEPDAHWVYDTETGEASQHLGRREAGYWYKTQRTGTEQLQMRFVQEEERDDLPLVNALRADVKRWRESNYRNATNVTRELLNHWTREEVERRLFFCQREAVETIIWLAEIRRAGKRTGFNPQFTDDDLKKLVDTPALSDLPELIRYGCKMATGSGKTVVMAMLIAWAFCNRGKVPSDDRFPRAALVVCPNLTIKERLMAAIQPNDVEGETPLLPILNRYKPIGTSAEVDFMTTRSCHATERSQINQVVLDTETWERSASFRLEQSDVVDYYARNDHLGLGIPYEYTDVSHSYEPDFIVRLKNDVNLIVEIKGHETDRELAKYAGAERWVSAVNNWNELGQWDFHVCRDPQLLEHELRYIVQRN